MAANGLDNSGTKPHNDGNQNAAVLELAHRRLDELAANATEDHVWGWVRIGVRFRDGQAKQVALQIEGTDVLEENSDNVD